ncbi:E3 ubiquitin-protein ligase TRIM39-like isoform X1 [Pleurodeles waltl]|uniref:E3 ubiquitin-protein ligase TRIM39-like isoform X1 n=2 Tax=Pleurodeles waltl TaxID=8319 RepID=UPI0037098424
MAEANGFLDFWGDFTCSMCSEDTRYPVAVDCGHHFCPSCITQCWGRREENFPCPICGRICQAKKLFSNWQLRIPGQELKQEDMNICTKHEQPLQMFCEDDQELICLVCWTSTDHEMHRVSKIEEAGQHYKAKLKGLLCPLKQEIEYKCQEQHQHKTMMVKLGIELKKIEADIEELHNLLREKEQTKLKMDLEMTATEKVDDVELPDERASLEALVIEIEKKCKEPAWEFLKDVRSTLIRCSQAQVQKAEPKVKRKLEQVKSPKEMEKCVKRRTFPKLGHAIKSYQVKVILDPDTAHPDLLVLGCRRLVKVILGKQSVPDNPKRFMNYRCVLGSKGFTSGKHYWEVLLLYGGHNWSIGVAAESVKRKGCFRWSPKENVWALRKCAHEYWALSYQPISLLVHWGFVKLGVYLDYEEGRLSFYNAVSLNHLFTFTCKFFPFKIFPIFGVGDRTEMRLQ